MAIVQPVMVTVREVAEVLRISRASAYRLVDDGTIPSVRLGRSVRVPAWWLDKVTRSGVGG